MSVPRKVVSMHHILLFHGSSPSSASMVILYLLHFAQLLHEQAWAVQCLATPFGGEWQEDNPLPSPPWPKVKGVTHGPRDDFPSMGWGSPWSRGRKARCWVFHPQRALVLLKEVAISEKAFPSGFDGASSNWVHHCLQAPHGAVH